MQKSSFFIIFFLIGFVSGRSAAMEITVKNDDGYPSFQETGNWRTSDYSGYEDSSYRFTEWEEEYSTAMWTPEIEEADFYQVSAVFLASPNRTYQAPYTITHADGTDEVVISQYDSAGRGRIREEILGTHYFDEGTDGNVVLSNDGGEGVYIADTMRFVSQPSPSVEITEMTMDPQYPGKEDSVTVSAQVAPQRLVEEVEVHYTVEPEGIEEEITAFHVGDDYYEAEIPSQPSQSIVRFHFSVEDTEGETYTSDHISYQVEKGEYRAIWVDAWGNLFHWPARAEELVQTCRDNNINTIMLQVRKVGDAYYDSSIEPWATNIYGPDDYDPLQYIIDLAHDTSDGQEYIHVHAWFVTQRIDTVGEMKQNHPDHILYQHPEYMMEDDTGSTIYSNSYYLDPGHPGTVEWNIDVILDCMENYDIDGVNLDYVRYPGGNWGYNPTSLQRFQEAYDRDDVPEPDDSQWSDWRRLQNTNQVKKLYVRMMQKDPEVILTPCTVNWGFNYTEETYPDSSAYNGVFQDWVGWLREGIIDYNAFMNYTRSHHYDRYVGWTDLSLANDDIRGSIIGIGAYLHDTVQDSMDKLQYARDEGAAGLNIYSYGNEVNANTEGETAEDFYDALSSELFEEWVDPPVAEWKEYPTKGIVEGTITYEDEPVDFCSVIRDEDEDTRVYSDGKGWYGMLEVPVGTHILTFYREGYPQRQVEVEIEEGGDIVTEDIELSEPTLLDYDASIISYKVPEKMSAENTYTVELTLENTGNESWRMEDNTYLGAVGDEDLLTGPENWRVGMEQDIEPGEEYTFIITLYPQTEGTFTTEWQMLREKDFWFGEEFSKELQIHQRTDVDNQQWERFK